MYKVPLFQKGGIVKGPMFGKRTINAVLVGAVALSTAALAENRTSADPMSEVVRIARGIRAVHPRLKKEQYASYAIGIHRASKRFGIHPSILIAITQQESGFRSNLPEGPAGEIGVCQILKRWLKHPELKATFGALKPKDLYRPATSFQIAAWILRDLKENNPVGALPYWSYYNARNFQSRYRYFLRVSGKLVAIRDRAPDVFSDAVLNGPTRNLAQVGFVTESKGLRRSKKLRLVKTDSTTVAQNESANRRARESAQTLLLKTASLAFPARRIEPVAD